MVIGKTGESTQSNNYSEVALKWKISPVFREGIKASVWKLYFETTKVWDPLAVYPCSWSTAMFEWLQTLKLSWKQNKLGNIRGNYFIFNLLQDITAWIRVDMSQSDSSIARLPLHQKYKKYGNTIHIEIALSKKGIGIFKAFQISSHRRWQQHVSGRVFFAAWKASFPRKEVICLKRKRRIIL